MMMCSDVDLLVCVFTAWRKRSHAQRDFSEVGRMKEEIKHGVLTHLDNGPDRTKTAPKKKQTDAILKDASDQNKSQRAGL
jgi:hypothetical protein